MRVLYILMFLMVWAVPPVQAEPLSLAEALALAGQNDPMLEQSLSRARALDDKSIADRQLADPKVKFAMQNFPVGDFSYTQEGMTQVVAGISQALPRGHTLEYKSKRTSLMADTERAYYEDQKRQISLFVQQNWLDIYYWQQAVKTVEESKKALEKVIKTTEAAYGTGRRNMQDIISAELELNILEDRRVDINQQLEVAQANLGKWIGQPAAGRGVSQDFPTLPSVQAYEVLQNNLLKHPKIAASEAMIKAGDQGVKIAEEQYKPGFNVGLNYGFRGGNLTNGENRPDLVTAMVTFDVPFFTGKRQDRRLSARKHEAASATFMRDDALRNLGTMLDREYANWTRLGERVKHYDVNVVKRSEESFKASLRAYQEDRADFSSLMRAQVMVLDAKLQWMKLKTDQAKAQATLLYLQGENK